MQRRDIVTAALSLAVAEVPRTARSAAPEPALPAAHGRRTGTLSDFEQAAGVGTVDDNFPPGDVRRYGAGGRGKSDDSGAWRTAVSTGHLVIGGGPEQL